MDSAISKAAATIFLLLGSGAFVSFFAVLAAPGLAPDGLSAAAFYMLATAGAVMTGLGLVLINTTGEGTTRENILVATAATFALLALMRWAAILYAPAALDQFAAILPMEVVVFSALSLVLYLNALKPIELGSRFKSVLSSFYSVPVPVIIWVNVFLAPINLAGYFFMDHPVGLATAMAFTYVLIMNMGMAMVQRGVSRATSIPHLVPWIPLQVFLYAVLFLGAFGGVEAGSAVFYFAWVLFIINGVSIAFDLLDTARWVQGDRAPAGS